jgi:hypothetical protein
MSVHGTSHGKGISIFCFASGILACPALHQVPDQSAQLVRESAPAARKDFLFHKGSATTSQLVPFRSRQPSQEAQRLESDWIVRSYNGRLRRTASAFGLCNVFVSETTCGGAQIRPHENNVGMLADKSPHPQSHRLAGIVGYVCG